MSVPSPSGITWHHSGSKRHDTTCKEIDQWARAERKPKRPTHFPYDFGIEVYGKVVPGTVFGRRLTDFGAHCIGFNGYKNTPRYIGIGLIGDLTLYSPSVQQLRSLRSLTIFLSYQYKIPLERVDLHFERSDTDCPGNMWDPHAERRALAMWMWTEAEESED